MKNREIYTRRSMLATLASSSLGLALLSQTERVFAQALLAPIPISTPPPPPTNGKKYYVQQGADKKNNGLSAAKPFPTLQQAADLTQPGDTVYVMNGTYSDVAPVRPGQQYPDGALVITRSGNQKAPITYRNYPGHQPVIKVPASCQNSIALLSVSYINIIGLTVEGNSASFNSTDAYNNRSTILPKYNTNGIAIRPAAPNAAISHHIQILANTVHHCPGVGISADTADHVVIRHNITYANAWYSVYAGSGISCIRSRDVDNTTGYKTFVVQNISYQNRSYIPYHVTNALSDGNGIIIDSNKTPPKEAYYPPYKGGTFVANNLSFENGGSGIHAYSCQHVDIINNTVWNNSQTAETKWASLFASHSDNVHLLNNIAYMLMQDRPTNNNALNTNSVIYDYNIYFNGQAPVSMGKHDLIINPSFAKLVPKLGDINIANFSLGSNSPALNSGTTQIVPDVDITGLTRPIGYVDRGAYQGKTSLSISQWYAQALASYNTF